MLVRIGVLVGLACLFLPSAWGGNKDSLRFGVEPNPKSFPQGTPRQTLASVLKAVDLKRVDYLLAHLADPEWVELRAREYEGGFPELVKEATDTLDAAAVKKLQRFLKEGAFEIVDGTAVARLKNVKDRVVRLRKVDGRWFLQSPFKP